VFNEFSKCRYVFSEVGLVSGLVWRIRLIVGTCTASSAYSRDVFSEVGLVSGRVRKGLVNLGLDRLNQLSVVTFPKRSVNVGT